MRSRMLALAVMGLALALSAAPAPASSYTMEILVDGRPLPVLPHRGRSYVEAVQDREYAIRLTNHTGQRVAVALSVDGLGSIDAAHRRARDARKWILDPWQSITVPGWQTGSGTARRFVFTTERRSYGAWLGRTSDLGVISAAFFRERPQVTMIQGGTARESEQKVRSESAPGAPAAKDDLAATGIGREVDHRVVRVAFDAEDAPASVVSFRYEYRDALVRLGVLSCDGGDALARRERARGFEDDGFAPDPFRDR